jgi:predicted transposase/invertase (TIGR01784 family)
MKEKLSMKDDLVFKAFFSRNTSYLKSFLEAIFQYEIKIKKVIHDARLEQLAKEMKYGILDLEVELENGEIINVEMQLRDNKNIEKRTCYYASKKIVEQLEPTEDYNKLKKVIIIAILDYNLTNLPDYVNETVRVLKNYKDYELNNLAKFYYIELEKFRNTNPNMKEKINQWLAFIDMERGDLLEMAKNENDEIKNAVEEYTVLTGNEEIKRLAEIRLMSKLEENSALETARIKGTEEGLRQGKEEGLKQGKEEGLRKGKEEGLKQGKEEGLTQGKKEGIKAGRNEEKKSIAQKMKKSGKFSMKQIIEITGLTKDEIDLLE